jgi:hypothetical protein
MGPNYSKHVTAWLADEGGTPIGDPCEPAPLAVNEKRDIELRTTTKAFAETDVVCLWLGWRDSHGRLHDQRSSLEVHF